MGSKKKTKVSPYWYGTGQRTEKTCGVRGTDMEEAGVPAVICCVYSGQSRPDRLMILQVLVLCGACTVQMCLCGAAEG